MKTKCPYCGYKADQHETLDYQTLPNKGEISFCINCAGVSEFIEDGLKKVDVSKLDEDMKHQLKDLDTAWVKTRNLRKGRELED